MENPENKQKVEAKHEVRIHIDRKPYESTTPTTGVALYALAHIPSEKELIREVQGDHEDVPIPRNEDQIHLKMDEHFYSEKEFKIIVNSREKIVTEKELSFAEIVSLAFDNPPKWPRYLVYDHLQERSTQKPRRQSARGRNSQNQKWDDLQCHTH